MFCPLKRGHLFNPNSYTAKQVEDQGEKQLRDVERTDLSPLNLSSESLSLSLLSSESGHRDSQEFNPHKYLLTYLGCG